MLKQRILIISPDAEKIKGWLAEKITELFVISIHLAGNAIVGLKKVKKYRPALIIVDDELPDMNGMSFATVVKDMIGSSNSSIYLFNVEKLLQNTKADYFLPVIDSEAELKRILIMQVKAFFENQYLQMMHHDELEAKKAEQLENLPKSIETGKFVISSVFSPFDELSGDGFDYWLGEKEEGIYGFLFDCTGHGPESYSLVGYIREALKKNCRLMQVGYFQNLAEVLEDINFDIFNTAKNSDPSPTAAIVFYVDFKAEVLHLCTAGMPGFFIRYNGADEFEKHISRNYLLGFIPEATYDPEDVSLKNVSELMFSSDGFSELLYHRNNLPKPIAKHDDVSAITIQLIRDEQKEKIEETKSGS